MKRVHFNSALTALILLAATGCMIPPIFYPPTRVHGYVRDTDGNPMTNVVVEASSLPPRLNFWMTPRVVHHTRSGINGHWEYSERKVGKLSVEAIPPKGYQQFYGPQGIGCLAAIGPFRDGEQPTNDFVLILQKLPAEPIQK